MVQPQSLMRRASWVLLAVLCAGVAGYAAVAYTVKPLGSLVHPQMRVVFETYSLGIYLHIFGSLLALLIGPLQFSSRLRAGNISLHRWLGRIYLGVGVLIGGLAGLFMAFHAFGGSFARLGFLGLAVGWLYTGTRAWLAIRARDIPTHRAWMIRNFSLTFAAVTLRLYLPAAGIADIPFETAYPWIAWLCWVPNLLAAEFLIGRARPRSVQPTAQPG